MSGKQTERPDCCVEVLADSPSNAETLASAGPSSKLVDQDQWVFSCSLEHAWTFDHLAHEGGNPFDLEVRGPHSSYDGVNYRGLEL